MESTQEHPERARKDTVEVTVPAATLVIRHARCPNGCLLMASDVPIGGHPSIHVRVAHGDEVGDVYLDPVYGSFEHRSAMEIPEGITVAFACPHCGVSLQEPDVFCKTCSAPVFAMQLPRHGRIEGCTRKGCFSHRLEVVDLGAQLLRLYEDTQMDAFL